MPSFPLKTAPKLVRQTSQASWTSSGFVSVGLHALTAMLLLVGGGLFPTLLVLPTERRDPTIEILSRPSDDATVTLETEFAENELDPERPPLKIVSPAPDHRAAETPMQRRDVSQPTSAARTPSPASGTERPPSGSPATRLRRPTRRIVVPQMANPAASPPSSVGQTGAESKLAPVKIYNPAPSFPIAAIGKSGTVELLIFVQPTGKVEDVQVERSSGVAEFDQAAVEAVRQWRFLPALQRNTGIRRCRQEIEFLPPRQ